VSSKKGVIAAGHYHATAAGIRMFAKGGNAIDAGAAAGFAVPTPVEQYVGNAARVALETEINYLMFGEKDAAKALADAEENIRKIVAEEKARRGIR
jgi:gamma-glutamyltranspeptidase